jgi:hypothetical protein
MSKHYPGDSLAQVHELTYPCGCSRFVLDHGLRVVGVREGREGALRFELASDAAHLLADLQRGNPRTLTIVYESPRYLSEDEARDAIARFPVAFALAPAGAAGWYTPTPEFLQALQAMQRAAKDVPVSAEKGGAR